MGSSAEDLMFDAAMGPASVHFLCTSSRSEPRLNPQVMVGGLTAALEMASCPLDLSTEATSLSGVPCHGSGSDKTGVVPQLGRNDLHLIVEELPALSFKLNADKIEQIIPSKDHTTRKNDHLRVQ